MQKSGCGLSKGKTPRSVNWRRSEVMCLIECHNTVEIMVKERVRMGFGVPPMTSKEKYVQVALALSQKHPVPGRTWEQCKTKWENISKEYKAILDYSNSTGSGDYWMMSADERKEAARRFCHLPINGDKEVFDKVDSHKGLGRCSSIPRSMTKDIDQDEDFTQDNGTENSHGPPSPFNSAYSGSPTVDIAGMRSTNSDHTSTSTSSIDGPIHASINTPLLSNLGTPPNINANIDATTSAAGTSNLNIPSLNTGKRKRNNSSATDAASIATAMDRNSATMSEALKVQSETASKTMENMLEIQKRVADANEQDMTNKHTFQVGLLDVLKDLVGAIRETNSKI